jgi:hypothetical protein
MGAVNAHAIHALDEKVADQFILRCGFRWHGDHDSHMTVRRDFAKERLRILLK